jgi:AraC-like DNA-binding protein
MVQGFTEFPTLSLARSVPLRCGDFENAFGSALGERLALEGERGEGRRDFLSFGRGLRAAHSRFRPARDSVGECEGQGLFKLHFSLEGRNTLRYGRGREEVVPAPSLSMSLHPAGLPKLDCHPRDVWEHSLTFTCRPGLLAEAMSADPSDLPAAVRSFTEGDDTQLYCKTLPLPARARRLIEALLAPECDRRMAHLHAEARALDLFCLGVEHLIETPARRSRPAPVARQARALESARLHLDGNFLTPVSIGWLARRSGLSRTALTAGFRALFGETVGEYLARLRMGHARSMLEHGHSAAAVAAELGYRHQSSFSTAFRTYFGRAPSAARKP